MVPLTSKKAISKVFVRNGCLRVFLDHLSELNTALLLRALSPYTTLSKSNVSVVDMSIFTQNLMSILCSTIMTITHGNCRLPLLLLNWTVHAHLHVWGKTIKLHCRDITHAHIFFLAIKNQSRNFWDKGCRCIFLYKKSVILNFEHVRARTHTHIYIDGW